MERQLERNRAVERAERGGGKLTSKKIMKFFFCCVGYDKPTAAGSCAPAGGDCKRDRG